MISIAPETCDARTSPVIAVRRRVYLVNAYPETAGLYQSIQTAILGSRRGSTEITVSPEDADIILFTGAEYDLEPIRSHSLAKRYPAKCVVYDRSPYPPDTLSGVYTNMPQPGFDAGRMAAFGYIDAPPLDAGEVDPSDIQPDLLFGFRGQRNVSVRDRLLELDHPRGEIVDTTQLFIAHQAQAEDSRHRRLYREQILRSKFVLCPRGWGVSSYRLYETMMCRRVPVVLSDEWVAPAGPDWEACIVRIPESRVKEIPRMLLEMEGRWDELASNAHEAWESWFSPPVIFERLIDCCEHVLHNRAGKPMHRGVPSLYGFSRYLRFSAGRVEVRIRSLGRRTRRLMASSK